MERLNSFSKDLPEYYLMNKDVPVLRFNVDPRIQAINILEEYSKLPYWITNPRLFIRNRRAPKHRENLEKLLTMSGCDTLQGFLDITHALSLVDTFWVKLTDSKLDWRSVSLYTNPFNEVVAKTAFEGGLHGNNLLTTSPEYGTDGSFAKCWIREDGQIKLLKRGSSGARNAGLEPYSEYYACQLIEAFTDEFVRYDLRSKSGRVCTVCDIVTSEEYGLLPYNAIDPGNTDLETVFAKMDELGFLDKVKRMFVIDAVIMNEDRHKNNFGFIVDNDKQEIVGMAPLYDHNVSLLPYAEEDNFEDWEEYLSHKGPRIGWDWFTSVRQCLDPGMRKVLIDLSDFKFTKHPKYNLPDWRLEMLEKIIHANIRRMLED